MKELVSKIMNIASNLTLTSEEKEKAITDIINEDVKEPLVNSAVTWINENTYEKEDDYERFLQMYFNESYDAMEELRKVMEEVEIN